MRPCYPLLLSAAVLELSDAWGPILDPVKGGGEGFATMRLMMLKSKDSDEHEDKPILHPFTLDYRESRRSLGGDLIPRLFISRPLLVDFDVFGVVNPFEDHQYPEARTDAPADFEDEDEEEDCVIPEEYKQLKPEDAAYVLDYLGIHRAKPVQSALHQHVER